MTDPELHEARVWGEMEAALRLMEAAHKPQRQDIRRMWEEATNLTRKAMLAQSEVCVTFLLERP